MTVWKCGQTSGWPLALAAKWPPSAAHSLLALAVFRPIDWSRPWRETVSAAVGDFSKRADFLWHKQRSRRSSHSTMFLLLWGNNLSAAAPLVKPVCQVASVSCSLLMARNLESQRQVMWTLKERMECCCQSPSWQAEPLVVSCFWHWNTDTCLLSCWCHRNQRLENSCDYATGKQAQRQNAKKDSVLFLLFRIGPKISPLKIFPEWNIYLTNSKSMSLHYHFCEILFCGKKQFYVSTRIYTCIYSCLFFFC